MEKDVVIFVNAIRPRTFQALQEYETASKRRFTPIVLVDEKIKEAIFACNGQYDLPESVEVITADFSSATSIRSALKPYQDRFFAITAQYENSIQELRQILPYVPYLPTPSETSLVWATEKKLMRRMLEAYNADLVPKYKELAGDEPGSVEAIEAELTYPLIIKPSGLEGSLLVTRVSDRKELEATLDRTFAAMQESYDTWVKRQKPTVLVEEFMEGDMYSIDVYVNSRGACSFTPPVGVIVGRQVGYEDFFGYRRYLPSGLTTQETRGAEQAAEDACHALNLKSVTAHVELMHTVSGWKIIELGPRIGGYRYELYQRAYGINHIVNDIRNRANEEPDIPTELKEYVSVFDIYPHQEGMLKAVRGIEETKKLSSFFYLKQNIFVGEQVKFAKNGGDVVVNIMLSNPDKAQLDKDIATMEAAVTFDVEGS